MTGRELNGSVEGLFRDLGHETELTWEPRDDGVDVIARRDDVVGMTTTMHIQCKNHAAPIGVEVVRALAGVAPADDPGGRPALICPAGFSTEATRCAAQRGVQLFDRQRLAELLARTSAARAHEPSGRE